MSAGAISVVDADGHLIESIPEMAEYMAPEAKEYALNPPRNRAGVFPSIDGMHYPETEENTAASRINPVRASDGRPGSGEDIFEFVKKAEIADSVLYATEGLSLGFIQQPSYAVKVCRAYNDYVNDLALTR